jgi:hypothetical protein
MNPADTAHEAKMSAREQKDFPISNASTSVPSRMPSKKMLSNQPGHSQSLYALSSMDLAVWQQRKESSLPGTSSPGGHQPKALSRKSSQTYLSRTASLDDSTLLQEESPCSHDSQRWASDADQVEQGLCSPLIVEQEYFQQREADVMGRGIMKAIPIVSGIILGSLAAGGLMMKFLIG